MSDLERLKSLAQSDPLEFRKLMQAVQSKVVRLHPAQEEVAASEARFKVMNAGRRTGKTVLAAREGLKRARQENKMVWWVAPTYKVVKRGYKEVLRQLPKELLTHDPPPDSYFDAGRSVILRFKTGSTMEFYSAERPEGMLGEGVDYAILDEAAIMQSHIWEQTVYPTLMDHSGGALFISTPRGRNWFYRNWRFGQDPQQPLWASWTFPTSSNPYIAPEEIQTLKDTLPTVVFQQEVEAKFVASGSSIFMVSDSARQEDFILDNGLVKNVPPRGHCVLGIDLAQSSDFTVLYGARSHDRKNIFFERFNEVAWSEQKRRIRRAVRTLKARGASEVTLCIDEGNAGKPIVEELEEQGYDVIGVNFTTHKNNMVKLLAKDLEVAHAFVLTDARAEEFENYLMNITPAGRYTYSAPAGEHDDVVSAKMLQHWAMVNEGVPGATLLMTDAAPADPVYNDGEPWDDLVDDDEETTAVLLEAMRRPTPNELMANPEVWQRYVP
jgi:hypothetical protein